MGNEYEYENELLKKENKKLKKQFQTYTKNDYNEEFIKKALEEFYDIVINIKSISSLSKEEGWPIKINKKIKDINNINLKSLFKIGILGNGNIGKSFLLSRLFNEKIPVGYSVLTEGLSIKFKENEYVILDSAGLQTPLLRSTHNESINKGIDKENKDNTDNKDDKDNKDNKDDKDNKENKENKENKDNKDDKDNKENKDNKDNKEYQNLYKDKAQTENFIQNLILYLSDMFVIVVGKLTFNEQKLINRIKHDMGQRRTEGIDQIFIIHNLLNFQKINQVEEHIKNTLMSVVSFNLSKQSDFNRKKENKNNFYYVENEKKIPLII